jgi:hypothetical protein
MKKMEDVWDYEVAVEMEVVVMTEGDVNCVIHLLGGRPDHATEGKGNEKHVYVESEHEDEGDDDAEDEDEEEE